MVDPGDRPAAGGRRARRLRPFAESDYPALSALRNRTYPDEALSEAELRHEDQLWTDGLVKLRLLAEDAGGSLLGYGEVSHRPGRYHPRRYWLELGVAPEQRNRGLGGALYGALLDELRHRGAELLRAWLGTEQADGERFLRRRGFAEVQRYWELALDPSTVGPAAVDAAARQLAEQGLAVTSLAVEQARDPASLERIYALFSAVRLDQPTLDPISPLSYETWHAAFVAAPGALSNGYFVVCAGERYVAQTSLASLEAEPGVAYTGFTGVLPEYRGRGVAAALKLVSLDFARRQGFREVRTGNDSRNAPMLAVNRRLGFRARREQVSLELRLGD